MKNTSHVYHSCDLQKLRDDIHRALDFRIDEFQKLSQFIEILPTSNKIAWLKSEEVLFIFYELLIKHQYIDCNFTFFQAHFMGNEVSPSKIQFLRPTNQLPYIIKALERADYIAECETPHIRLAQHFLDRFGKPIKNNVLRSSLEKGLGKKSEQFIDEKIIGELLKYKITVDEDDV